MLPPLSKAKADFARAKVNPWSRMHPAGRLAVLLTLLGFVSTFILDVRRATANQGPWCDNTCTAVDAIDNGVCQDGGLGSIAEVDCAFGTDCYDCGMRLKWSVRWYKES
jgi:hypothetical protein